MKNISVKRTFSSLLLVSLLSTAACGGSESTTDTTVPTADTTTQEETTAGYDYSGVDYGGYEFKLFNFDQCWGCTIRLDLEDQTGEVMDDAIYARNQKVEEQMNITISEIQFKYTSWNAAQVGMADQFIQSVLAGDNAYDAAYLPVSFKPSLVTDGYLMDMKTIPEMQLDEEWWDSALNDTLTINGKLFTASSPLYLMSMDQATVLYFNKDMFDNLKLEYPYELVRDGKWTLDKLKEYVTATTNLNGDDSFSFKADGNAVYGIGGHHDYPIGMVYAAGGRILEREGDSFVLGFEEERYYNAVEKLADILSASDGNALFYAAINWVAEANPGNLFTGERAAFATLQVKDALLMRDSEVGFGLLPMPKYDAAQESYYSYVMETTNMLGIPKTCEDPARTGKILDALSYESNLTCLPLYYDTVLAFKGMRDEDSIEMLQIVKETRVTEFAQYLGVTNSYANALNSSLYKEQGGQASLAASHKSAIEENLKSLLEEIE